ncbi:MAG: right-handed parallel beta-helix repeat-containing protein [Planctomycetota bacterium]|jgi:predicted outer membrane repeat protein
MSAKANPSTLLATSLLFAVASAASAGQIIYVDADANVGGDGFTWATAFKDLQDALADANSKVKPVEIWVAAGTYTPDCNSAEPNGTGDREATFQLIDGVRVDGGYAGFGEPEPNARNIDLHETILSGDLAGNDDGFVHNDENSYHVVTGSSTDATAVLDGFTVTSGNGDRGSGMCNEFGSPTVSNCRFSLNSANICAAGMYNYFSGIITISNCTFRDNSAIYDGGAIFNWISTPVLTNLVFSGNTAGGYGGGMFTNHGSATLVNCTFSENSADGYGGGIYNAKLYGEVVLTNCIFWGNAAEEGPQIGLGEPVMSGAETFVSYCDIQGGHLDVYDPGELLRWGDGNVDADPCFADEPGGDYHLQSTAGRWDANTSTWAIDGNYSPCIDTGDPNSDWTAELWPHGKRINMGAFGGTPQASMSQSEAGNIADLDSSDAVDGIDLRLFTDRWLYQQVLLVEDLNRDGLVDGADFAILADNWCWKQ